MKTELFFAEHQVHCLLCVSVCFFTVRVIWLKKKVLKHCRPSFFPFFWIPPPHQSVMCEGFFPVLKAVTEVCFLNGRGKKNCTTFYFRFLFLAWFLVYRELCRVLGFLLCFAFQFRAVFFRKMDVLGHVFDGLKTFLMGDYFELERRTEEGPMKKFFWRNMS